jgi:hypothetical protein
MIKRKEVDRAKLIKMVENGKNRSEIMKEFEFNTASEFKTHYLNALMESADKLQSKREKDEIKVMDNMKKFSVTFKKVVEIDINFYEDNKDDYFSFLDFVIQSEIGNGIIEDEWKIEEVE